MLFKDFTQDDIQDFILWSQSKTASYGPLEYIFQEKDPADFAYILLKGQVEIEELTLDGTRTLVTSFTKPYSIFGEVYAILNKPFDYSAQAKEDTILLKVPREAFFPLLNGKGQDKFSRNLVCLLANKAYTLNQRLQVQSAKSIRDKIVRDLKQRENKGQVTMNLTREAWAQYLGIPRPSLSRELAKMQEEGLLSIKEKVFTLYPSSF